VERASMREDGRTRKSWARAGAAEREVIGRTAPDLSSRFVGSSDTPFYIWRDCVKHMKARMHAVPSTHAHAIHAPTQRARPPKPARYLDTAEVGTWADVAIWTRPREEGREEGRKGG
jgi:hypothetical protein